MDDRKNNTGHKEQQGHGNIVNMVGIVNNGMILI